MRIDKAEIYSLHIPFLFGFTHSRASRLASDSIILKLTSDGHEGYGEAVVRDYVSGSLGEGNPLDNMKDIVVKLLDTLPEGDTDATISWLKEVSVDHHELPVLCAFETALLDLACSTSGKDIYDLIGVEPLRTSILYGGTLPILSMPEAEAIIDRTIELDLQYLRLKLGPDTDYNRKILALAREKMGDDFDIRIDANMAWDWDSVFTHLEILRDAGVSVVEEPFGRNPAMIKRCVEEPRSDGFAFVADESILSMDDLELIAAERTFSMLNLRLSKNGGLFRCLNLARAADEYGISYQLGCLVGETGILSAAGRVAASLMHNPVYADGSYDSFLLSDNIVKDDLTFGAGGKAGIVRDRGIGFKIVEDRLVGLSNDHRVCV